MTKTTAGVWNSLKNGLRRKCPRCGEGHVLDGWMTVAPRCEVCHLVYERDPGDTWGFWIVADRIPLAVAIALVYFGLGPASWMRGALFLAAFGILQVATIPNRVGFVVALDYLTRLWWPESDPPEAPEPS
jgi:uncharacterized protein (DUF983 family)